MNAAETVDTRVTQHNPPSKALNLFAWFTAVSTLVLISIGGLVTSHGVGMAVPDWPTTYGYNMFLFPISQWVGGIFYEHTHRLVASGVGFLTVILCVWFWVAEKRRWLKWMGRLALILVIIQGVLGGLRVTMLKDEIGIFHGTLAQLFFLLTVFLAIVTTRSWRDLSAWRAFAPATAGLRNLVLITTILIFVQLMLGASMRHQHSGLAVPDFPLAHGRIYPKTDAETLQKYNLSRVDSRDFKPVTAAQVHLHMAHRAGAFLITGFVFAVWLRMRRATLPRSFHILSRIWVALILAQFALGVATVLSNKAADIATMHVVGGALSLCVGFTLVLLSKRHLWEHAQPLVAQRQNEPSAPQPLPA